jgi:hypothetical protein
VARQEIMQAQDKKLEEMQHKEMKFKCKIIKMEQTN